MPSPADVLDFWFGELDPGRHDVSDERVRLWFQKSEETDEKIRRRFGATVEAALKGELNLWAREDEGAMALVLVLDQFTRNIFRQTPRAFAGDERARRVVLDGLEDYQDLRLHPVQRSFFYLPLEHAEDMELQNLAVRKFRELMEFVDDEATERYAGFLDYALRHREIIDRFGRFPHRNSILGRESTDEEIEFLKQPGSRF